MLTPQLLRQLFLSGVSNLDVNFFLHVIAEIQWRWWELFAQQLESVVVLVVREFYSNLDENKDSYTAQSCLIPFDPRTINRLF